MDRWAGLEAFITTVEENGFSPAARKMGVATSSVTRLVDNLEHYLGTTLLNRSTRRITLTAAGEVFYQQARRILSDLEEMEKNIRDLDTEPRGLLKVSMPVALGRLHIMPMIYRFMRECPAIKIDAHLSDEPVDMMRQDVDISIRIGELPAIASLIVTKLSSQRRHVVGTTTYFNLFGLPDKPEDLKRHACLAYAYTSGPDMWRFAKPEHLHLVEKVPLQPSFRANNSEVLLDAVRHHLGIALLPDWLVQPYLDSGEIISVLNQYLANPHGMQSAIYILYPENRKTMKKVRAFVDFLKQSFGTDY